MLHWVAAGCHAGLLSLAGATNVGRMLAAFARRRLPGPELTIDHQRAAKVPFGVAAVVAVLVYAAAEPWITI